MLLSRLRLANYCVSDIISKCGVGVLIYQITYAKSSKEGLKNSVDVRTSK